MCLRHLSFDCALVNDGLWIGGNIYGYEEPSAATVDDFLKVLSESDIRPSFTKSFQTWKSHDRSDIETYSPAVALYYVSWDFVKSLSQHVTLYFHSGGSLSVVIMAEI